MHKRYSLLKNVIWVALVAAVVELLLHLVRKGFNPLAKRATGAGRIKCRVRRADPGDHVQQGDAAEVKNSTVAGIVPIPEKAIFAPPFRK